MKPGRGIFCPFRVNPRIFSGSPTHLSFPLYPPALLPSLFALPTVSCSSTFDPSTYVHLLHSFHLFFLRPLRSPYHILSIPSLFLASIDLSLLFTCFSLYFFLFRFLSQFRWLQVIQQQWCHCIISLSQKSCILVLFDAAKLVTCVMKSAWHKLLYLLIQNCTIIKKIILLLNYSL